MSPKLAPLVRLLGSPVDGEVLATVAALRRTLAASGQDLHDLARLIERGFPAAPAAAYRPAPAPNPEWRASWQREEERTREAAAGKARKAAKMQARAEALAETLKGTFHAAATVARMAAERRRGAAA